MTGAVYSRQQVSEHDGRIDERIWIIYKNSVYDVTDYLNEHPGGSELIMEFAGSDITTAFNDAGHSSQAINLLKSLKIGDLIEEDNIKNEKKKKMEKTMIIISEDLKKNENTKRKYRKLLFPLFRSCSA